MAGHLCQFKENLSDTLFEVDVNCYPMNILYERPEAKPQCNASHCQIVLKLSHLHHTIIFENKHNKSTQKTI